jgi:hypothetical protein
VGDVTPGPAPDPAENASGGDRSTLTRVTTFVYWHLVVGALLCVATVPSVVALLLLGRAPANAVLVPLCLIPHGPALSAALYALRDRTRSESLAPAPAFWRGYRLNAADVLRVWVPAMAGLAVVVGGIVNLDAAGVAPAYAGVLVVIGLLLTLWALDAVTIASFFSFRTRDVARLAAYYLVRQLRVTVTLLALVVVAVGMVRLTTEAVLWLFTIVLVAFWYAGARPLIEDVTARFVAPAD